MKRLLMDINEDSEILSKLGILSSKASSATKNSPRKGDDFIDVKMDDWKWETDEPTDASDAEQSEEDFAYDKHTLLEEHTARQGNTRRTGGITCTNVLLSSSFIALGLSSSILGPTLPDIGLATNSNGILPLSYVICSNAFGYLLGNVILSRLFTRLSPMMFLLFCVLGTAPSLLLIASSSSLSVVNFYSFMLGILLGSIHRGALIVMYGKGGGVRALFTLHVFLALGACMAPLMSAPFVFNTIRSGGLSPSTLTAEHLLLKRELHSVNFLNESDFGIKDLNSTGNIATAVPKPKRPDHVVGQGSLIEPKSKENELKRMEVEKKNKQVGKQSPTKNCSSTGNSTNCIEQDLSDTSKNLLPKNEATSQRDPLHETVSNTGGNLVNPSTNPSSSSLPINASKLSSDISTASTVTSRIAASTTPVLHIKVQPVVTPSSISDRKRFDAANVTGEIVDSGLSSVIPSTNRTRQFDESAMWEIVKQQVADLNDMKLLYAIIALLCCCCAIPFIVSFVCCCEQLSMVPDLQIAKLRRDPEKCRDVANDGLLCYWRWLARFYFMLIGGVEMSLGGLLTLYVLGIFPDQPSQLDGALVTSAFWAGILLMRILCVFSLRLGNSPRLMQFFLLVACAICGFNVYYPSATPQAASLQLFLIGTFVSVLLPGVLGWLDTQLVLSRLSSTTLYGASISVGRIVVPYLSAVLMSKCSKAIHVYLM
uniref:Major facilitator superfamily (MFS) profile domain-containing protein n=1 Tax=Parascaris univalens TaxID=6257 RepID=A0A915A8W1_PARUN